MKEISIYSLRVNRLSEPFGVVAPKFSWKLRSTRDDARQLAYRITVGERGGAVAWDSGEVASGNSLAVEYAGAPLKEASAYEWSVSVKDETGAWTTSPAARFETALDAASWAPAKWVAAHTPVWNDFDSTLLVKTVANAKEVREAWWFVTGQGVFEAYVGGKPVSHRRADGTLERDALKPGFTHCQKRRQYFGYDITHLVRRGAGEANTFSAVVSAGWWRDQITGHGGRESAFRAVLVIRYADGGEERVVTDATWLSTCGGPMMKADIFYGEDYDACLERAWMAVATGEKKPQNHDVARSAIWGPAREIDEFKGETVPLKGLPVRHRDDLALKPVSMRVWSGVEGAGEDRFGHVRVVRECAPGEEVTLYPGENLLIDFGQNAAAVPDFVFSAKRNVRLTVRVAEMLNDGDGAFARHNDGPEGDLYKDNYREARAEAHYIFAGEDEESYRPQFTFFGYRYISLSCSRGLVTLRRVRSIPVTSVSPEAETGSLETGAPLINRLIANGVWGHRSNYLSVPTDCPQRNERLGWSADTQVFTPTACYNADVYSFLSKWMDDMVDSQH
ncbi:MAG: family 78 glycoside hydrolase catalytic domain, partial [Kiritimatiellae bacterium]|nr:family 78 glycoside hydrolase catalytic domain [Kiritimatiellia bacterium]